jgi:hypothetical protein
MPGRGFASTVATATIAVVVLTGLARAQDVYVTYQINNWTLAPAITGQAVKGFLAYADAGSIAGANISVVWYQREADGSWTTWAWPGYDLCDAALYVRARYSDNLIFEQEPVLSDAAWATPSGHAPKQVVNGLFFDDPVQSLVEGSPEPEALVSTLVNIGWEAAPDLSPLAVTNPVFCDPTQPAKDAVAALMDAEVYHTEMRLFGTSLIELLCGAAPCTGCATVYGGKQPRAGSTWRFRRRVVLSDGSAVCYYDRDAVVNWHEEGVSYIFCNQCNGSGQITTTMHAETYSGAGDSGCHPPP